MVYMDGEYVEVINLSVWYLWSGQNLVSDIFGPMFQNDNPHIRLDITSFGFDREQYLEQIRLAFMAGNAPDLFLIDNLNYKDPDTVRFLADWFPIMYAQPNFYEGDYFMNVFHAASFQGELFAFPTHFFWGMVAANTTVPGLAYELNQKAGVTAYDLIQLAEKFDSSLYIHQFFDPVVASLFSIFSGGYVQRFIDMEARTADFNNQDFINFITAARDFTNPDALQDLGANIQVIDNAQEAQLSHRYFFLYYMPTTPQYLLPIENLIFDGHVPLVNHKGELVINPWTAWGLNGSATPNQKQAAWEFVKFMQSPRFSDMFGSQRMVPTYKPLMRHEFIQSVPNDILFRQNGWITAEGRIEAILDAISVIESFASMPMVDSRIIPDSIVDIKVEVIDQFERGFVTAEQAAEYLQNRVTLALMEMNW